MMLMFLRRKTEPEGGFGGALDGPADQSHNSWVERRTVGDADQSES